jgi:hypothetical protein
MSSDFDQMPKETNKETAINALLNSSSVAEAATKCDLSEKTLRRYLAEPTLAEIEKLFRQA